MIFTVQQLTVFTLILARIAGVFIQAPLFSSRSFPFMAKTALAIWITIVLWFVTPVYPNLPTTLSAFVLVLVLEVTLGFAIGLLSNIIFTAIQSGGEIIDMQMGLSVASALDPLFGAVISVIGRLVFTTALVIFVMVDGHHLLLSAFHQTFTVLPAGKIANFASPDLVSILMDASNTLWLTAIKIAAPAVLLIFLSDFSFGIVSRVAPQVNVFMLGFQVKPALGIVALLLSLPFIIKYINQLMVFMAGQLVLLSNAVK